MRAGLKTTLAATLAATAMLLTAEAKAFDNVFLESGGGSFAFQTKTLRDYRYRDVVIQQRDFSCGSAALATMLRYHYGRKVNETTVLQAMYATGDQEKIRKEGFSLLDMKKYLKSIGLKSEGYKISLDKLANVGIPAIALLNIDGYLHFVLVRGISSAKVLVADPALGMKTYSRDKFKEMWNGIFFVILSEKERGKKRFNIAKYWGYDHRHHNLHQAAFNRELSPLTLHLSIAPGYF